MKTRAADSAFVTMEIGSSQDLLEPCPECGSVLDVSECPPLSKVVCPSCQHEFTVRTQFNHFTLIDVLGEGGMGSVFRARDNTLDREVALKILKAEYLESAEDRQQLETEAQITASINHPHVVKVFSYGEDAGNFYIAMEVVEKGSLDDLIGIEHRVPEAQALTVAIQVAQGLEAAHEHGLIHRDLKPGNILFADAHTCKLVDFGLAILMKDEANARGEVWGTPYYIAPERLNAEPEDFRSDMYSLGGTIFHALAGRPPFEAETASMVALKHIKSRNVSLQAFAPQVSSETSYIINRTLDKDPDRRYQSYAELIEHLEYARANLLERAGQQRKKEVVRIEDDQGRKITAIVTIVLLLSALAVGGGLFLFRDAVFGGGAVSQQERAEQLADVNARYAAAKEALFTGQTPAALTQFKQVWEDQDTPQPLRNWAGFNAGIANYLLAREAQALKMFKAVAAARNFAAPPNEPQLHSFFADVARLLDERTEAGRGIRPLEIELFNPDNYEAMALIPFALYNWDIGDFDAAIPAVERFLQGHRPVSYAWIDDYKPLMLRYYNDLERYRRVSRLVREASTPEEVEAALTEVDAARNASDVGGKMLEALARLEVQLKSR